MGRLIIIVVLSFFIFITLSEFWITEKTKYVSERNYIWFEYLGGPERNQYSSLDQIDTSNVNELEVAWEYHTGAPGQMQFNPIIIDGVLYGVTAKNDVFALNASNGEELWKYKADKEKNFLTNRGVTYWENGSDKRILFTYKEWLIALHAKTGQPIKSFGNDGRVSLKSGLGEGIENKYLMSRTPGTIYEDLIIMPLVMIEGAGAAPGYIQAFDVQTGELVWVFHTIPKPGEFGYNTWPKNVHGDGIIGGANNWAGMAIDHERGILYAPTGSAAPDFFGGSRKGRNLFASSLLALDAKTGERIWHYQFVRHDLWDRDPPAPPILTTISREGKEIEVVAQVTKTGHVFVFNRETGASIFPIEEVEVPTSVIPEEDAWPTQPLPALPASFSRQTLTEDDLNIYSPDYDSLLQAFRNYKKGRFIPFSETPTIIFPGLNGGAEWGGAAVDQSGIMYVNSNEIPWVESLIPTSLKKGSFSPGENIYRNNCGSCHGMDRTGNPVSGYPSLVDMEQTLEEDEVSKIISNGRGMMPGFTQLSSKEKNELINFLFDKEEKEISIDINSKIDGSDESEMVPWKVDRHRKFLDSEGVPGISPPWGTLTAINLNNGKHQWRIPLGDSKRYDGKKTSPTGTENYGGPVATSGGLLLIAATKDAKIRAFNKKTGKLLWDFKLPAAGFATPSTYEVNGKQYIVIAAGGTKLGLDKGDSVIAFSLPDSCCKN